MEVDPRHAIEGMLKTDREHEALAVYADLLLAEGDPRGELIAIDLHIDAHGPNAELEARRHQILAPWIGAHPRITCRYGLVEIDVTRHNLDPLERVLTSPLADHIRWLRVSQNAEQAIAMLAARTQPWLARLSFERTDWEPRHISMPPELRASLVTATPHLDLLEIDTTPVLGPFVHETVRRLRLVGLDVLDGLMVERTVLPAVTEIVLALELPDTSQVVLEAPRIPPACVPSLRKLDLSSCTSVPIATLLKNAGVLKSLEHLWLPSLVSQGDAMLLRATASLLPELVEIRVAGKLWHR